MNPGIGIGGKARAIFPSGTDMLNWRFFDQLIEGQHIIAWNAKDMMQAKVVQPFEEERADRFRHGLVSFVNHLLNYTEKDYYEEKNRLF
ncbi:MAG: hypothetical protein NPIRA02_14540 [Nitrospirales bacterium]|nr:MAG: hypothetical protein NPIRA02_14540 [Nitrospirales bacterium]